MDISFAPRMTVIPTDSLFTQDHGGFESRFHFSFAEYQDPENLGFGVLRVLNDDMVVPSFGFEPHPHCNMEVLSYCVDGFLTHEDSLGHSVTLGRGDLQCMSAGTGLEHTEYNASEQDVLRFIQIWILPDREGHDPVYQSLSSVEADRKNRWSHLASREGEGGGLFLLQDCNVWVTELEPQRGIVFPLRAGRQAYVLCIEGPAVVGERQMESRDGAKVFGGVPLRIRSDNGCHVLLVEMAAGHGIR